MKSKTPSSKPKSPLHQLQYSLAPNLRNHAFKEIKCYLRRVGLEKLDLKLTTTQQQDVLEQIENQLVNDFPNIFCGRRSADRLQCARQAIIRQHGADRNNQGYARRRTRIAEKDAKDGPHSDGGIIDLTMLEDSDEEFKPSSLTNISPPRTRGKSQAVTTVDPRVRSRSTFSISTSYASTPSSSSAPAQKLAKTATSMSYPPCAPCPSPHDVNIGKKGLSQVHYFLQSCSPPLVHLLSRFVDLGFKSADVLDEVACHWTRDERLELLKKLQASRDSRSEGVSELELFALDRRFYKYSLELNGM